MASSLYTTLFMSAILFSFSSQNVVTGSKTKSNSPLIGKLCTMTMDPKYCVQFLQSQPQVALSKNMHDAAISILNLGISNVTNTMKYVRKSFNNPRIAPNVKAALQACSTSYDTVFASYNSALKEVKSGSTSEGTATYDLQVGCFDYMQPCIDAVASAKINDAIVLRGNNAVQKFGSYAVAAIGQL